MKRRTFISLMGVMAAAGVLSLTGCSSKDTAASSTAGSATLNKLDSIQKSGKLVVALEGAWQPWSYHDASDTLVGYDVEVSRAIAEKLGVEPEYVESDWDSLFAGLDAGRYDMVCNGVPRPTLSPPPTATSTLHWRCARITRTSTALRT